MIIAITGSIGSGKSLVAVNLARLAGAEICDADVICRDLLERDNAGWQGVVDKWGQRYLHKDGTINRPLLRTAIFDDLQKRQDLEDILHPYVRVQVQTRISLARRDMRWLIVEIPLLFETGWQGDFDCAITVYADVATCIKRVVKRDGVTEEQAVKTFASQMDIEQKKKLADYTIDNSGSKSKSVIRVEEIYRQLQESIPLDKSTKISRKNT